MSNLSYGNINWSTTLATDMSPPFIGEDKCLMPGELVVRVERATQNSQRIFASIDIPDASVDNVWGLLTDYPNLGRVVPNLVVNKVLELLYPNGLDRSGMANNNGDDDDDDNDNDNDAAARRWSLASRMNGTILQQVSGAKVTGINFFARTILEVREWPAGMPNFLSTLQLNDNGVVNSKSTSLQFRESARRELAQYVFPRPYALSLFPHMDISMQSMPDDDGKFRMYQGV